MNQLKIKLLIILLILLFCINRKIENFKSKAKKQRDLRERYLDRCTDDLERLLNKFNQADLLKLGIRQSPKDGTSTRHGFKENGEYEVEYDTGIERDSKFPKLTNEHKSSIFVDMSDLEDVSYKEDVVDSNKITADTKVNIHGDFGIHGVTSKFRLNSASNDAT